MRASGEADREQHSDALHYMPCSKTDTASGLRFNAVSIRHARPKSRRGSSPEVEIW